MGLKKLRKPTGINHDWHGPRNGLLRFGKVYSCVTVIVCCMKFISRPRLTPLSLFPSAYRPPSLTRPSLFAVASKSMGSLVGTDWKQVDKPGAIRYQVFTKPIIKSEQDDRDYRIIQLENGLQATLVHDINADKAAASLDVAVGHLYDPVCCSCVRRSSSHSTPLGRYARTCPFLRTLIVYGANQVAD